MQTEKPSQAPSDPPSVDMKEAVVYLAVSVMDLTFSDMK